MPVGYEVLENIKTHVIALGKYPMNHLQLNTLFLSLFIAVPTFAQEAVEQGGEPIVEQVADSSFSLYQ